MSEIGSFILMIYVFFAFRTIDTVNLLTLSFNNLDTSFNSVLLPLLILISFYFL